MLLLPPDRLAERAAAAAGPLAPLARSLADDLRPLVARTPELPRVKAQLTRVGGRCARDGTLLSFDPYAPHDHRCPRCGTVYAGEAHDRWWVLWYQLWLAERAVHAAVLAALVPHEAEAHARLADALLDQCAERYLDYPNVDNALGPTRPFFSTYLESIWLLQLCAAVSAREWGGPRFSSGARVRDRVVEPSAALIAGFDEGASNRQVWNNAARLAAARLLGRPAEVEAIVFAPSGVVSHLGGGLLADGSWYEGENYHLFAHRGLWYGVQLARAAGVALPDDLVRRYAEGFAPPFVTALPDLTFPARRDSQYAVSLRQWRFAESAELGLAEHDDPRLVAALHALYDGDVPRGDPGRWRSTAESERNEPASSLTRADLNWRSLLWARPELPPLAAAATPSALLEAQGLAVFRRDGGATYAALDYGHSGGGHGHPDRLNVLLARGRTRWLDDAGTGSYVDPSLFWYRSTLAHNAPLVRGRSQQPVHGVLTGYEERPAAGWVEATVVGAAPDARLRRAIVVLDDYLVDAFDATLGADGWVDLPLHVDGEVAGAAWAAADPTPPDGAGAPADGWHYLTDGERTPLPATPLRLDARAGGECAAVWLCAPGGGELWRATAPGVPGSPPARFHFARLRGPVVRITTVWSWAGGVAAVGFDGDALRVERHDGTRHEHARTPDGWHVGLYADTARSSIDLAGLHAADESTAAGPAPTSSASRPLALTPGHPITLVLGEPHYRRSELTWEESGRPTATVELAATGGELRIAIDVHRSARAFTAAGAENPLDNDAAEVNGDGVQLHLRTAAGLAAWRLVPEPDGTGVRVTPASQHAVALVPRARWAPTAAGYRIELGLPLAPLGAAPALDVLVNDVDPGRARRRGQLVLSGGAGEFVYLRGDRQPPERYLTLAVADA